MNAARLSMIACSLGLTAACVAEPVAEHAATPATRPSEPSLQDRTWSAYGLPTDEGGSIEQAVADEGEALVAVADVLADPSKYADEEIYVKGNVIAVCQSSGCWVKLMPEGDEFVNRPGLDTTSVFVKLTCPSEGFLVPVDSVDRTAVSRGKVVVEEIDEASARHIAEEDGATDAEVAAIVGPQKVVRLMTPGVWIASH